MKHTGKMKNNGAKVVIAYRTLPGDPLSALVVGTNVLGDTYHDSLMTLLQTNEAQSANELADILSVRRFPDGSNMLEWFHVNGHLKKVPTNGVLVTPTPQSSVPLDELNVIIAEQKGVKLEDLAVTDGTVKDESKPLIKEEIVVSDIVVPETKKAVVVETTDEISDPVLVAKSYRSKADKLAKDAANFRRMADAIDPPKAKESKAKKTVEA
jgi:hypothetical protein